MSIIRVIYRIIALLINQLIFTIIGIILFCLYRRNQKKHWEQTSIYSRQWARCCCFIMNVHVKVIGEKIPQRGSLIVANHVGTTDILVLGSCFEVVFVSKQEISQWPLVGLAARLGGTIFIDRSKRRNVSEMISEITKRLENGCSVAIFPEGGIEDEVVIRPFKSSAFEAAIKSGANTVPVHIHYIEEKNSSVARWTGASFLAHKWALIKKTRLEVNLTILPSIQGESNRRIVAERCQQLICEANEKG